MLLQANLDKPVCSRAVCGRLLVLENVRLFKSNIVGKFEMKVELLVMQGSREVSPAWDQKMAKAWEPCGWRGQCLLWPACRGRGPWVHGDEACENNENGQAVPTQGSDTGNEEGEGDPHVLVL